MEEYEDEDVRVRLPSGEEPKNIVAKFNDADLDKGLGYAQAKKTLNLYKLKLPSELKKRYFRRY